MIITWIARLIAGLNANRRPGEIAAGISMGVLLALIPAGNLLWVALFVVTVFVKLHLGNELPVLALLKPAIPLADPLLHTLGLQILTAGGLQTVLTALYNVPLVPFTRFNNTVVAGGLAAGVALWIPLFFIGRLLVVVYRRTIHPRLAESRVVKAFQRIPIVSKISALVKQFQRVYSIVG
jgi:uncharacterized protein (TIGR03546 family)